MATQRWTEASLRSRWDRWPDMPEYRALREAKRLFDAEGPTTRWCQCGYHCRCDGQGYRAVPLADGRKTAAVRRARNQYGYESGIYVSDCNDVSARKWLTRWDGVPLLGGNAPVHEEHTHIVRQPRITTQDLPPVYIRHDHRPRGVELDPTAVRVRRK